MELRKIKEILIEEHWKVYSLLPSFYQQRCRREFFDIADEICGLCDNEELNGFIWLYQEITLEKWIQIHLKKEN